MSQIGGQIVGSLVVDISAPPEKAVAGLKVVEAETARVAAKTAKSGETAGAAFGLGMARGIGKTARVFNSVLNGLLLGPSVVIGAYELGNKIGTAIFTGVDSNLKRLEARVAETTKIVDGLFESAYKRGQEAAKQRGGPTTAELSQIDASISAAKEDFAKATQRRNAASQELTYLLSLNQSKQGTVSDRSIQIAEQKLAALDAQVKTLGQQIQDLRDKRQSTASEGSEIKAFEKAVSKAVAEAVRDALREQQAQFAAQLDQLVTQVGDISRIQQLRGYQE